MQKKIISIVIPAYKEEKNITLVYSEIIGVIAQLDSDYCFEIIFINDGSPDKTWEKILELCLQDSRVKGINLSRNFGKEIALSAGVESALGDAVITLDGDGQHPIEKIPLFVKEWENGFDIVYNVRPRNEGATFTKRLTSRLFYMIFNSFSDLKIEKYTTDYRLLDKKVVENFLMFREKNRSYRGLTDWMGFNKKALVFDAVKRIGGGESSYSYGKLIKLALNSMTSFSLFPLKLVGYLGAIISTLSSLIGVFVIFDKIFTHWFGFSNLVLIVIFNTWIMGIVLVALGFIALYIANIHEEVLRRPIYMVKDKINFK